MEDSVRERSIHLQCKLENLALSNEFCRALHTYNSKMLYA